MHGVDACGCGWIQFICPLIWVLILEFGFCKGSDTRKDLRIKGLDWCLGNGEKLSDSGCIEDIDHLFIQCNFARELGLHTSELHIIQEILLAEKKKLNIRLWMHIK
ncbi:hypothetical protein ES332_A05G440900v1 [Gossypium tomentosum]|uniref:Uncharacterized protein n=1 Tax=Gossypium tomentosum TaxID=34277 RepID=A0A5D2QRM2_GOSTO|nr:hypothetical protein ES332_A05G440900v1 [Gossypium tomentosum]